MHDLGIFRDYANSLLGALYLVRDRVSFDYSVLVDNFSEISAREALELAQDSDRSQISQKYNDARERNASYTHTYRLVIREHTLWVSEFGSPRDGSALPEFFVAIRPVIYNTAKKHMSFDGSNIDLLVRQHLALDASVGGLAILSDERYVYANQSHCEMYGYTQDECLGQSWRALYGLEEQRRIEAEVFPKLLETGKWAGAVLGQKKDGGAVDIYISLNISEAGDLVCSCIDISQQKAFERRLLTSHKELLAAIEGTTRLNEERSLLLNTSSEIILAFDDLGFLEYANKAAESFFRFLFVEGIHLSEILPKKICDLMLCRNGNSPNARDYSFEASLGEHQGQSILIEGKQSSFYDSQSRIHHRAFIQDVTVRRLAARALEEARDSFRQMCLDLLQSARQREHALASISHEFRTPLANIITMTDLILDGHYGSLSSVLSERLGAMHRSSRHLYDLVSDTIDFSALASGAVVLKKCKVRVSEIVAEAATLTGELVTFKNQRLMQVLAADERLIDVDKKRIVQALVNLIGNASKFSADGSSIVVDAKVEQDECVFRVLDAGIGIAPENINRLFEPYSQIDSKLGRAHGGTGLGLALVRRIAQAHGGRVTILSELGRGTAVSVFLPVLTSTQPAPTNELIRLLDAERSPTQLGSRRCVILGLNAARETSVLARNLSDCGFSNYKCVNALQFAELLQQTTTSCGFMILGDQSEDTFAHLQEIRRVSVAYGKRICLMGSLPIAGPVIGRITACADAVLRNPYSVADLLAITYSMTAHDILR